MDNSTNTLIMLAIYIFIFLAAISVTILLFGSIYTYSENVYEYSNKIKGESIVEHTGISTAKKYNILRGNEIIAYINNYGYSNDYNYTDEKYTGSLKYTDKDMLNTRLIIKNINGDIIKGPFKINKVDLILLDSMINLNDYYNVTLNKILEEDNKNITYITIQKMTKDDANKLLEY